MKFENTIDFQNKLNAFKDLINQDPKETEPSQDGEYRLVPIRILEPDLHEIYNGAVDIVIDEYKEMFGHLTMRITLSVFHPVYERFFNYSGTAAILIQTEQPGEYKGTTKVNAVEQLKQAIAACYSECIKNAAKRIGNRFGQRVNRNNTKKAVDIAEEMIKKISKRKPKTVKSKPTVSQKKTAIKNKVSMP